MQAILLFLLFTISLSYSLLHSNVHYRTGKTQTLPFNKIVAKLPSNSETCNSLTELCAGNPAKKYNNGPSEERSGPRKPVKDDVIQVTGKVVESLPNAMFRVEIEPSKQVILATISGKIRKNSVRIVVGDSVSVELSAYDLSRGRITYRNK